MEVLRPRVTAITPTWFSGEQSQGEHQPPAWLVSSLIRDDKGREIMPRLDDNNLTLSQFSAQGDEVELTDDDLEKVVGGLKGTSQDPPTK